MSLNTSNYPMPGGPFVEQATASPGEQRRVVIPAEKRCWKSIADNTLNRCRLELGHDGPCEGLTGDELTQGSTDG